MAKQYLSYDDLAKVVRAAGILSVKDYVRWQSDFDNIPSAPHKIYKEWINWSVFLTGVDTISKIDYESARQFNMDNCIKTERDYRNATLSHPYLPKHPKSFYSGEWGGWREFLNKPNKDLLFDYASAKAHAQKLGISSNRAYREMCEVEGRFPLVPDQYYKGEWDSWFVFLGKEPLPEWYTYEEAMVVVKNLGIKSSTDYMTAGMHKLDPRLPSTPAKFYQGKWKSWAIFLLNVGLSKFTYEEAKNEVLRLGLKTRSEYLSAKKFKQNARLPLSPAQTYKSDWQGWPAFLGL